MHNIATLTFLLVKNSKIAVVRLLLIYTTSLLWAFKKQHFTTCHRLIQSIYCASQPGRDPFSV